MRLSYKGKIVGNHDDASAARKTTGSKGRKPRKHAASGDFIPYKEAIQKTVVPQAVLHPIHSRKPMSPASRQAMIDRIDTGMIMARLERNFHDAPHPTTGEIEPRLDASQLASAKLILDRTVPVLASTEQRIISDADKMSEAEILDKLRDALARDATLLAALGYERKKTPG